MDNTLTDLVKVIQNTKPYENLNELLGEELGNLIYKLIEEIDGRI